MSEQDDTPAEQPPKRKGNYRRTSGAFVKNDPRINRKGRPKTFEALRREAIKIAGELLVDPKTGDEISVAHAILRSWASGDAQAQKLFIEYAYGKVPQPQEITGKDGAAQKLIIEVVRRDDANGSTGAAESAPETGTDQA